MFVYTIDDIFTLILIGLFLLSILVIIGTIVIAKLIDLFNKIRWRNYGDRNQTGTKSE